MSDISSKNNPYQPTTSSFDNPKSMPAGERQTTMGGSNQTWTDTTDGTTQQSQSQSQARRQADQIKQQAQHAAEEMGHAAEKIGEQISDAAGQAQDWIRQRASSLASEQKARAGQEIAHFGSALRSAADRLHESNDHRIAEYAEMAAAQLESTSRYLNERGIEDLMEDAERFARRSPELFLGAMFFGGLALSRFLKASGRRREREEFESEYYEEEPFERDQFDRAEYEGMI